jgi:UDP:flavonoid glycosyltransferase YjiC (YdhE family)
MARILTVTAGLPSVLYASVELARRLAAAGHEVTHASLPPARGLVEHHGLGFLPLEPSRYEEFLAADARVSALHRLRDLRRRRYRAKDATAVGGFPAAVRDVRPDLILINGEMHEHIVAVSATGVPMALLNSFVSIWRRGGLPPPHHLVQPGRGWKGTRLAISSMWLALRLRKLRIATSQRVRRIGCDRLSVLRLLAREAGFDLRRETDDSQWLIPFTYRCFPVLSLHAWEFEFPHQPPDGVQYVGPMVLEARIDRALTEPDRTRLEALLERRRARGERRLVYAGFGSASSTEPTFLRRLCGVVAERPHWDLLISLGDRISPADLGRLPERAHAFSWVPQLTVLSHADVMVTHGGISTVDECVLSGVPMLIYCGFETDMGGTTARAVHHGLGIAGDRRRDHTPVIRDHLDRLLHEASFQTNLRHLQRLYAAYAENRVAERAVETLLARGTRERRLDRSTPPGAS